MKMKTELTSSSCQTGYPTLLKLTHHQILSKVKHTTKLFFMANARPNSFSGGTQDQTLFQVEQTTRLFFRLNTRPNSFSGQTYDQTLSQVKHTTRLFLRSNARPNSFSGRTHEGGKVNGVAKMKQLKTETSGETTKSDTQMAKLGKARSKHVN